MTAQCKLDQQREAQKQVSAVAVVEGGPAPRGGMINGLKAMGDDGGGHRIRRQQRRRNYSFLWLVPLFGPLPGASIDKNELLLQIQQMAIFGRYLGDGQKIWTK